MRNQFLVGDTVYLSALTTDDVSDRYTGWLNDPEVCRDNSHAIVPNTHARTIDYVKSVQGSNSTMAFAVRWKNNDDHIGNGSIQKIDWINRSAELAILIGEKDAWNKGVATEVYRLLIRYGFMVLNLNRISSAQTCRNAAMVKVCEKAGMIKEGLLREALFKNGEYLDVAVHALLLKDYEKPQNDGRIANEQIS